MSKIDELLLDARIPARFCTTHWSLVLRAGWGDEQRAAEALEQLCRAYWYPLYFYARRRGHSVEDAEDLTQGFIESLLRRKALAAVRPEKGRFRTFLLASFGHYMANEWRQGRCQKRGGGQVILALDGLPAEERYRHEPATAETPERLYDRQWAWAVMEQARQRVAVEYARAGKSDLFELLEPFLTGNRDPAGRMGIARRFGISTGAVDVTLHRLRRRYGECLRELIAETVSSPQEVDAEIRDLMEVLRER